MVTRFMTVILISDRAARVVFRGSLAQCQQVAGEYLRETFVLPSRF